MHYDRIGVCFIIEIHNLGGILVCHDGVILVVFAQLLERRLGHVKDGLHEFSSSDQFFDTLMNRLHGYLIKKCISIELRHIHTHLYLLSNHSFDPR